MDKEEIENGSLPPVESVISDNETPPNSEAPRKRGRGRPPGSGKKNPDGSPVAKPEKSKSRKASDVEAFAKQIQGIHEMIALITPFPEMRLSESESVMMAKALDAVAEEYGLELDGKTGAAIQLIGAAAMIYGPRALVIRARIAKMKAEQTVAENGVSVN